MRVPIDVQPYAFANARAASGQRHARRPRPPRLPRARAPRTRSVNKADRELQMDAMGIKTTGCATRSTSRPRARARSCRPSASRRRQLCQSFRIVSITNVRQHRSHSFTSRLEHDRQLARAIATALANVGHCHHELEPVIIESATEFRLQRVRSGREATSEADHGDSRAI